MGIRGGGVVVVVVVVVGLIYVSVEKPHKYTFQHNSRKLFDTCANVRKYENYQELRKRYHSFPRYNCIIIKGLKNEG